jgi:hypothetical protein
LKTTKVDEALSAAETLENHLLAWRSPPPGQQVIRGQQSAYQGNESLPRASRAASYLSNNRVNRHTAWGRPHRSLPGFGALNGLQEPLDFLFSALKLMLSVAAALEPGHKIVERIPILQENMCLAFWYRREGVLVLVAAQMSRACLVHLLVGFLEPPLIG